MAAPPPSLGAGPEPDAPEVVVYWRRGCPSCGSLRRTLRRAGIATTEVDIWADPTGAAEVRSATGGDETVPTVRIASTILVNPSPRSVVRLAVEAGVEPHRPPPWWRRLRPSRSPA